MEGQLVRPVERDEGGDGDQAAVALGRAGSLLEIPKQDLIGVALKRRSNIGKWPACRGRFIAPPVSFA
jgi:hypothetical protein